MTDFLTTHWSLIGDASEDDGSGFAEWVELYREPMVHFLVRVGASTDDAEEYVQAFLAQLTENRKLFDCADPARGRFRDLLRTSLENFVKNEHRRQTSQRRSPANGKLVGGNLPDLLPDRDRVDEPEVAWDRAWALGWFVRALESWRPECQAGDMRRWNLFLVRYLRPFRRRIAPPPYEEIYKELGYNSAKQAANATKYVKEGIERHLRNLLAEKLKSIGRNDSRRLQECVEEQFDDLMSLLQNALEHGLPDESERPPVATAEPADDEPAGDERHGSFAEIVSSPNTSFDCDLHLWAGLWLIDTAGRTPDEQRAFSSRQLLQSFVDAASDAGQPSPLAGSLAGECSPSELIERLGALIGHRNTSLELLVLIKDVARQQLSGSADRRLRAVYFAAIAQARLRHDHTISSLSEEQIRTGIQSCLSSSDLPADLSQPMTEWLEQFA